MKINIEKFCNPKDERIAFQKPFRIDGDGIYASNGIIMVYFSNVNNNIDIDSVPLAINVDIYKKCADLIKESRDMIDGFQPITTETLENVLKGITPIKLPVMEEIPCPDCNKTGTIECECDCGNQHEKICDKCQGEGYVDDKQISEEIQQTPVNFNKVCIDYKYLELCQEVIKDNNGIWEMRLKKEEVCVFRCDTILICVMPLNNYEKSK